jgi:FkbM family methyltransferase
MEYLTLKHTAIFLTDSTKSFLEKIFRAAGAFALSIGASFAPVMFRRLVVLFSAATIAMMKGHDYEVTNARFFRTRNAHSSTASKTNGAWVKHKDASPQNKMPTWRWRCTSSLFYIATISDSAQVPPFIALEPSIPLLSIVSPSTGSILTSTDSIAVSLSVDIFSCDIESDTCVSITDLAVCFFTGMGSETMVTRHLCVALEKPFNIGLTIIQHHLPAGIFNLEARLYRYAGNVSSTLISTSSPITLERRAKRGSTSMLPVAENSAATGLRLGTLRHGVFLFNINDMPAGVSLDSQGEWEESVVRLLVSVLEPGDVAVDVGAHLGSFTVPMARRVGPTGSVLSLEPQLDLFQELNANLALNGLFNVHSMRAAAASFEFQGERCIPIRDNSRGRSNHGSYSLLDTEAASITGARDVIAGTTGRATQSCRDGGTSFPIVALDALPFLEGRCLALMKVDVEGFEREVLLGAQSTLERCAPVLYLENQCRSTSPPLLDLLFELGYACFWDPAPYYSPDNFFRHLPDDAGSVSTPGISLNMLCLQDQRRDQWVILADVLAQLDRVVQGKYFVEDYFPVRLRSDVGYSSTAAPLKMAEC